MKHKVNCTVYSIAFSSIAHIMHFKILELYSGIGGMHCAWKESGESGEVVAAIDVNTVANVVYKHNFPDTLLLCRNIQSLSAQEIIRWGANVLLMSPPCQPFTRNGNCLDTDDARTSSFLHLLDVIKDATSVNYILMENVKGFESSVTRDLFIDSMRECNFETQEFLLNPADMGIPNSRLRYYCIAKRTPCKWPFSKKNEIIYELPDTRMDPFDLENIMEKQVDAKYNLQDKHLKGGNALDICNSRSKRSCCFTKAYTHYLNGTGSVFTNVDMTVVKDTFKRANEHEVGSQSYIDCLKPLNLRFFTPREVSRVMMFQESYGFPESITLKQSYRLLGNSINVKVVSELIKIMVAL